MAILHAVQAVFLAAGVARHEQDCSLTEEALLSRYSSLRSSTSQKSKASDLQSEEEEDVLRNAGYTQEKIERYSKLCKS